MVQALDWQLFRLVNGLAGQSAAIDAFFRLCAQGLEYVLLLLVATLWLTPAQNLRSTFYRQRLAVYAVLSALIALGVNQLVGLIWFRPRPFVYHQVTLLLPRSTDSSFPSDHAAGAFALAVALLLASDRWARRVGWAALGLAVLLAFARVYAGTHYPFDVLAGALAGAASAVLLRLVRRLIDPIAAWALLPLQRLTAALTDRLGFRRWGIPAQ